MFKKVAGFEKKEISQEIKDRLKDLKIKGIKTNFGVSDSPILVRPEPNKTYSGVRADIVIYDIDTQEIIAFILVHVRENTNKDNEDFFKKVYEHRMKTMAQIEIDSGQAREIVVTCRNKESINATVNWVAKHLQLYYQNKEKAGLNYEPAPLLFNNLN